MIIRSPEITEEEAEICVSARIELDRPGLELPDRLWFKFPRSFGNFVSPGADAFAAALLPSAMGLGEDLVVEGRVSPRLAYGIREYQHLLHTWFPEMFQVVEVTCDELEQGCGSASGAVGLAFSGGVDSSYTLWKHLPENESIPEHRLTHVLMINGFDKDVDLEQVGSFRRVRETYEPMIREQGLELVVLRNNLRLFRNATLGEANLRLSFGAALTASALALGDLFSRFYIAGPEAYNKVGQYPFGSHQLLDRWLSTEQLEIMHTGATATRAEKTAALAGWPATYSRLRVCDGPTRFNAESGLIENCCRCEKCLRTMITLELLNASHLYETFRQPLRRRDVRGARFLREGSRTDLRENLSVARETGRKDMVFDLRCAMLRSELLRFWRRIRTRTA